MFNNDDQDLNNKNFKDGEDEEESIRNKYKTSENVSSKGFKYDTNDPEDYFRKDSILHDLQRQKTINSFLNNRGVNPRSDRMIDRHNINSETIKRGKLFGADDWFGFLALTYMLYFFIVMKLYIKKSDYLEDEEKYNIYNALRDDQKEKKADTKNNIISVLEKSLAESTNLKNYEKERLRELSELMKKEDIKFKNFRNDKTVNLKEQFNESLS